MWYPVMHRPISGLSEQGTHHLPTPGFKQAVPTAVQYARTVFGRKVPLTLFFVYIYSFSVYMCTCVCKCTNHGSHKEVGGQLLRVGALLVSSWALTQAVRLGGKRLSPPHTILPVPVLRLPHSSSWPWGAAIPSRDGYYRRTQIINQRTPGR